MRFLIVGGGYAAVSAVAWIEKLFPKAEAVVVSSWQFGSSMAFDAGEEGLLANTDYSTFTVGGVPLIDAPPAGGCLFPA